MHDNNRKQLGAKGGRVHSRTNRSFTIITHLFCFIVVVCIRFDCPTAQTNAVMFLIAANRCETARKSEKLCAEHEHYNFADFIEILHGFYSHLSFFPLIFLHVYTKSNEMTAKERKNKKLLQSKERGRKKERETRNDDAIGLHFWQCFHFERIQSIKLWIILRTKGNPNLFLYLSLSNSYAHCHVTTIVCMLWGITTTREICLNAKLNHIQRILIRL